MQQAVVDLPPEVARMANQAVATGGTLIGRLADMAQQMGVPQVRGWALEGRVEGMQTGSFAVCDTGAAACYVCAICGLRALPACCYVVLCTHYAACIPALWCDSHSPCLVSMPPPSNAHASH